MNRRAVPTLIALACAPVWAQDTWQAEFTTCLKQGQRELAARHPATARVHLEKARKLARGAGAQAEEGLSELQIGLCDLIEGKRESGFRHYARSLELMRAAYGGKDHDDVAEVLLTTGSMYETFGRSREAAPYLEEALGMRRRIHGPDAPILVPTLKALAMTLNNVGRAPDAWPQFAEALRILNKVRPNGDAETARIEVEAATCLNSLGRTGPAMNHAARGLQLAARYLPKGHPTIADAVRTIGEVSMARGDFRNAGDAFAKALAMHESARRYMDVAYDRCLLAELMNRTGRSDKALGLANEALRATSGRYGERHPLVLRCARALAASLQALGRFSEAERVFGRALNAAIAMYPAGHPDIASSATGLARCLMDSGRPERALRLLTSAAVEYRRMLGDKHPFLADAYANLGVCYWTLGRPDRALANQSAGLRIRREHLPGDHPETAVHLDNLATYLGALHQYEEAAARSSEALAMLRRVHEGDHVDVALAMTNLAHLLDRKGDRKSGLEHATQAHAMAHRLYGDQHVVTARLLAERALRADDNAGLRSALEVLEHQQSPLVGTYASLLGAKLLRAGRYAEARPFLVRAVELLESMRRESRGLAERDRAAYIGSDAADAYAGLVECEIRAGRVDAAFGLLERSRARGVLSLLARSRVDLAALAREALNERGDDARLKELGAILGEVSRLQRDADRLMHAVSVREGLPPADRGDLDKLRGELRTTRHALQIVRSRRAGLVRDLVPIVAPASADDVQGLLGKDERLLYYLLGASHSFLFVVQPRGGKIDCVELPVTAKRVADEVESYRDAVHIEGERARAVGVKPSTPRGDPAAGARLFAMLVPKAVWRDIRDCDLVYIVPHGALHRLPFETLVVKDAANAKERQYWIDEGHGPPIVYGSSGSHLLVTRLLRAEQRAAKRAAPLAVVALGDPVYARQKGAGPAPLPGTRDEVLAIYETVVGSPYPGKGGTTMEVLLQEDATKPRLTELAGRARILHIATHHVVDNNDRASFSRLLLTMPREATAADDGVLKLIDVLEGWRGRLTQCELVVLSACSTQEGFRQRDEGVFAMPLAFSYAGCPSVVASLWNVADEATTQLMGSFYRNLAGGSGAGKVGALREACRALRAKRPEPFFWAPFVFIGDPR